MAKFKIGDEVRAKRDLMAEDDSCESFKKGETDLITSMNEFYLRFGCDKSGWPEDEFTLVDEKEKSVLVPKELLKEAVGLIHDGWEKWLDDKWTVDPVAKETYDKLKKIIGE